MSKLSDWQSLITEIDVMKATLETIPVEAFPQYYADYNKKREQLDWQTIARQALKIALAAEAYCTPPFDSKNTLPPLIDALKEIQS